MKSLLLSAAVIAALATSALSQEAPKQSALLIVTPTDLIQMCSAGNSADTDCVQDIIAKSNIVVLNATILDAQFKRELQQMIRDVLTARLAGK